MEGMRVERTCIGQREEKESRLPPIFGFVINSTCPAIILCSWIATEPYRFTVSTAPVGVKYLCAAHMQTRPNSV